jgi:hypothetical protein
MISSFKGPLSVLCVFLLCFGVEKVWNPNPTTHFLDKSEYVPILSANIFADLFIIFLTFTKVFYTSETLSNWYRTYRLSAMIADILIGVLYILLARYLVYVFKWNIGLTLFAGLAVGIQIFLDYLFYLFFTVLPRGQNDMLDFFKDYAKEVKQDAIFGDSVLVIFAVTLSAIFNNYGFDFNIVMLILSVYLAPFFVYMKN